MTRYKDYAPTGMDARGLNGERHGIAEWFVLPVMRSPDSGIADESNFDAALRELGGESDTVQVHRFGHWGCGWYELILVHPDRESAGEEIEASLENYPILDEHDHSEREWATKAEYWERASIRERVELCQRARCSVFAARHDEMPQDSRVDEYINVK